MPKLRGYSLIELLIVISIFGITVSLVTASYLSFERNQRFKSAALQLKNDIRFAQNKSLTGDKSTAGCSAAGAALLGWYVNVSTTTASSYSLFSDCRNVSGSEVTNLLNGAVLPLPRGVTICSVTADGTEKGDLNIFFQPLSTAGRFFLSSLPTPPFYTAGGTLKVPQENSPIEIYLENNTTDCKTPGTYKVIIQSTGEVNETKL